MRRQVRSLQQFAYAEDHSRFAGNTAFFEKVRSAGQFVIEIAVEDQSVKPGFPVKRPENGKDLMIAHIPFIDSVKFGGELKVHFRTCPDKGIASVFGNVFVCAAQIDDSARTVPAKLPDRIAQTFPVFCQIITAECFQCGSASESFIQERILVFRGDLPHFYHERSRVP